MKALLGVAALVAGLLLFAASTTGAAAQQGTIVLSAGSDVTAFNALDSVTLVPTRMLFDHVGEGLVRTIGGEFKPWLATSWTNVEPTVWEFKLRQGVKFQDGEPFDAKAVKFTVDLIENPANQSLFRGTFSYIKDVEIVDDYTVRIVTRDPYPQILTRLVDLSFIPPSYVQKVGIDGYRKKPIGTGPYRFVEWVPDDHLTLEAFDGYWGGKQKWKTIIYRPIPDAAARMAALSAGEIDFTTDIPPELQSMLKGSSAAKTVSRPSTRVFILLFNSKKKGSPMVNAALREAAAYSLDRDALARDVFDGAATPAAWLPDGTFGQNPALTPLKQDLPKAKKLLADAGYPNGIDLEMDTPNGRAINDLELAEAIGGQLSQAGIRTTVKPLEWGVFEKKIASADLAPISLDAWNDGILDIDGFSRAILKSDARASQGYYPELDTLLNQIAQEMDVNKRKALILQEQDLEQKLFPVAYVLHPNVIVGLSSKLADFNVPPDDRFRFYVNNIVPQN